MLHSNIRSTRRREHRGMAHRARRSGIAGAMLALAGCAADAEPAGPPGDVVARAPELVGELATRDGAKLTFTAERERGDGDPVVAITELAPGGAPAYLARLRDHGATSLEAFLALAPAGTDAPAVLREAHVREAAALGRSAEVRAVSVDAVTTLAPSDSSACDSYDAFTDNASGLLAVQTGSSTDNHSLTFHDGGHVHASMCNRDDAAQLDHKLAQFCYEDVFGLLQCASAILVPDGYMVSQLWNNATTGRVVRATKLNGVSVMSYLAIGALPAPP